MSTPTTTPNALPTVPESPAESQPAPIDDQGTAGNVLSPAVFANVQRASDAAIDQHLGESPKRKRGPDKKPRKPRSNSVPLGEMATGASDPLLAESSPQPLAGIVPDLPPYDEETARELVEIGLGLLNDGAAAIVKAIAKKETGDDSLAKEAGESVRMSEKIENTIRSGAVKCAKKYSVRLDLAPELMLGGGLVIWAGQVSLTAKAMKQKGAELRERQEQQRAA